MHDARWWSRLRLVRICSFVLLILAGCGEKSGTDGSTAGIGTSRLILRVMVADQGRSDLTSRAVLPGQTRQGETISLLRVEVSGEGIPETIVVNCPLPEGSLPQCQATETEDTITVVIELIVPDGFRRRLVVTAFDQTGRAILSGTTTIDIIEAVQHVVVTVTDTGMTIAPVNPNPLPTGSGGGTSALRSNGASDADGDPLSFAWALLTRPAGSQATVVHPSGVNPTLVVDRPGTYLVQLTVNEDQMDSLPDVVTIHTVDVHGHVLAPDDDLLPLAWWLIVIPPDSTAAVSNPGAENPTLTVDFPGIYVVQLIVHDGLLDRAHHDSGD